MRLIAFSSESSDKSIDVSSTVTIGCSSLSLGDSDSGLRSGNTSVIATLRRLSELCLLSRDVLGFDSALSRRFSLSLRCISLTFCNPSSSQRTDAVELDEDRGERIEIAEMPEAVDGGLSDEPLEIVEDGRPSAPKTRCADSDESRDLSIETGG